MHKINGTYCAALTPLNSDYTINQEMFLDHCNYLLSQGIDGLGVFGTTGEANSFSVKEKIEAMRLNEAIEEIMQYIRSVNKYMENNAPWKLVKDDKNAAGHVLYTAGEALRIGAVLFSPVMPNRTAILLDVLNAKGTNLNWGGLIPGDELTNHGPLFPRRI